tara:strand:+ start:12657 stop:13454 length:798 start_codon:yes stop_codon:yes gene_type:complete
MIIVCAVTLMILNIAPPAPPGATMVEIDVVRAEFRAQGEAGEYTASRRQSIATRFSSYTGIVSADIAVFVTNDPTTNASTVDVRVDHAIPTGTSTATIVSTLNNGILRSVDVLQAALTQTGGTIVSEVFPATVVTRYVAVYPPPSPGPAFSETMIIVITVGGVLALVALIFIARQCDSQSLNEFTILVLGVLNRVRGGGGGGETRSTPVSISNETVPSPLALVNKKSATVGAVSSSETLKHHQRETLTDVAVVVTNRNGGVDKKL